MCVQETMKYTLQKNMVAVTFIGHYNVVTRLEWTMSFTE